MTVVLTGRDLTRAELIRVARGGEAVALDPAAIATMRTSRAVVERSMERADPVYGLSTAVGVLKRVQVSGAEAAEYSRRMIRHHLVGQGPDAPSDLTRATMLRLANGFASGSVGVRPILAERLVEALNDGHLPRVRTLGSVGQADLAQMADVGDGLFGDLGAGRRRGPRPGEQQLVLDGLGRACRVRRGRSARRRGNGRGAQSRGARGQSDDAPPGDRRCPPLSGTRAEPGPAPRAARRSPSCGPEGTRATSRIR